MLGDDSSNRVGINLYTFARITFSCVQTKQHKTKFNVFSHFDKCLVAHCKNVLWGFALVVRGHYSYVLYVIRNFMPYPLCFQ